MSDCGVVEWSEECRGRLRGTEGRHCFDLRAWTRNSVRRWIWLYVYRWRGLRCLVYCAPLLVCECGIRGLLWRLFSISYRSKLRYLDITHLWSRRLKRRQHIACSSSVHASSRARNNHVMSRCLDVAGPQGDSGVAAPDLGKKCGRHERL
jgi:hypothetical protein